MTGAGAAQPSLMTATAEHAGRTCPYCRFPFKEGAQALLCGSCKAMHHMECWQDNRGCTVLGCPSAPDTQAAAPPPPMAQQAGFAGFQPPPPPPVQPPAPPVSQPAGFQAPVPPGQPPAPAGFQAPMPPGQPPAPAGFQAPMPPGQPAAPAGFQPPPPGFQPPVPPGGQAPPAPGGGSFAPAPTAAEFAQHVQTWLRTPTAIAIGTAALIALGVMAAVGFATAVLTPDNSFTGRAGAGADLFKEIVRNTVATTQARFGSSGFTFTLLPLVFVLAPIFGAALGTARTAHHTAGLALSRRLLIAALTGVPLALMVLILGLLGREAGAGFTSLSVIVLCLLWGAIGGVAGLAHVVGRDAVTSQLGDMVPSPAAKWLRLAWTALKPLGVLLAALAVLAVLIWELQIIRGQYSATFGRATATAIIETPLQAGELAVSGVALGTFAQFAPLGGETFGAPLPLDNDGDGTRFGEPFRIFAYQDAYPLVLFVPLLILLVGASLACATFAGFTTAAAAGARSPGPAAAYGAGVGAVWALALLLLKAVGAAQGIDGDSLFISVLLVGAAAGAVGGVLSTLRTAPT